MATTTNTANAEQPLDPAAEAIRRRLLRLMVISIGTMFIGLFAVLFAIVYKLNNSTEAPALIDTSVQLPAGFTVEESQINEGVLMLRGRQGDETRSIYLFDVTTGEPRGKIALQ